MLKSYLSCKYTIFNEVNEKKLNLKKIELSKNDQLRVEKGNVHEKNYLKELKKKYKKVIDLKNSDLTKEEKIEFIEGLSLGEFGAFKDFFATMPVLEKEITFTCKNTDCGKTSTFWMNGYLDFFV